MTNTDFPQSDPNSAKTTGCLKALVRFSWLLIGNGVLFFLLFAMVADKNRIAYDFAYWITVVILIGIRLLDIKKFAGETANFEPATMAHWRKYAIQVIIIALFGYILVKGLSYSNLF